MSEKNIDCAISHFDKKVTDYQLYVDRELIEQDKKIKTQENYLVNTLDSHKKLITDFIEENANAGSDAPTTAKFTKVYESGQIFTDNENGLPGECDIKNLNLTKCLIMVDFPDGLGGSFVFDVNGHAIAVYPRNEMGSGCVMFDCDVEDGILRTREYTVSSHSDPSYNTGNCSDHTGENGNIYFEDKINSIFVQMMGPSFNVTIYGR